MKIFKSPSVFDIARAVGYLLLIGNMLISYYHALELERALVSLPDPLPHVWVVSLDLVFILSVIVLSQSGGRGFLPWLLFLFGLAFTGWSNIRESYLAGDHEGIIVNGSTVVALLLLELLLRWMEKNREMFEEEEEEILPKVSREEENREEASSYRRETQETSGGEPPTSLLSEEERLSYQEEKRGALRESFGEWEDVAEESPQETHAYQEETAEAVQEETEESRDAAVPAEGILPEDSPASPKAEENEEAKEESTGDSPGGEEDSEKSPDSEESREEPGEETPAASPLDPFEWALDYFEKHGALPSRTQIMEATGVKEWPARQARSKVKKLVTNKKAV